MGDLFEMSLLKEIEPIKTKDFLQEKFREYYRSADIMLPPRFTAREWGFLNWGGGVMNRKCLFEKIREQYSLMMASYVGQCGLLQDYITSAGLLEDSGVKGAVLLAQDASLQKS